MSKKFKFDFVPAAVGAGIFALAGAVIGEFFPKLFSSGTLLSVIGNAVTEPFSKYRNELAMKYALFGLLTGAVLGIIYALVMKKK